VVCDDFFHDGFLLFINIIPQFWTACVVFGPLLWSEMRWWSPADSIKRNQMFVLAFVPVTLLFTAMTYGFPSIALLGIK